MDLRERIRDLLAAVRDVAAAGSGGSLLTIAGASARHQALLSAYVRDLREAKQTAESWWQDLIDTETSRVGDRREAEINVKLRRPSGCVVHPGVIHIIRYYWIECLRTNQQLSPQDRVAPEALILLWLDQSGKKELAEFIATIPFWPMGMDAKGNWI